MKSEPTTARGVESTPTNHRTLQRLKPLIERKLRKSAFTGSRSVPATLRYVFLQLFGVERSDRERMTFLLFAAPLARRIAIEHADPTDYIDLELKVSDMVSWFNWLDSFEPTCARILDLLYFAGLTPQQTAAALNTTPDAVTRDLQRAKAWLHTKLQGDARMTH